MQWKLEYLANEVNTLEEEKKKCINDIEILNNIRDEYRRAEYMYDSHLPQLRKEIYYMENQSRLPRLDNMIPGYGCLKR